MSYLDWLPEELFLVTSRYLDYEDYASVVSVVSIVNLTTDKYIAFNPILISREEYTLSTAPRFNLNILHPDTIEVPDSILISINNPDDFKKLTKYKNLVHANFVLPYNKDESMEFFKLYIDIFFDAIISRKDAKMKDLVFRLLYSSDTNNQLGIVMYKGFINLINAHKLKNYTEDNIMDLDFIILMIKDKIKKYNKNILLGYNLHSGEAPYILEKNLEDVYINDDILPTVFNETVEHDPNKMIVDIFTFIQEVAFNAPGLDFQRFNKFTIDDDYIILNIRYGDSLLIFGNEREKNINYMYSVVFDYEWI